jgi:hypothetical protein
LAGRPPDRVSRRGAVGVTRAHRMSAGQAGPATIPLWTR